MGLFTKDQISRINQVAEKSKEIAEFKPSGGTTKARGITNEIAEMSQKVIDYFPDSEAILISTVDELHEYVTKLIDAKICGLDTETTGLDRIKDYVVGASLYYPGGVECYIPMKHRVPIFDELCKGQLTYEEVGKEFQRIADSGTKVVFANADFDLAMVYKDLGVDLNDVCYYDVILAWRCLKEDEKDNALKVLYNKYVLKGQGDPMKFNDFFTPQLFPYCKPEVAKLYAAHDAKITYELYRWQLPFITKDNPKCKKHHLEAISDLIWNVEFPLIKVCQNMHRAGVFLDKEIASTLVVKYNTQLAQEKEVLAKMVDEIIDKSSFHLSPMQKVPFKTGKDFSPTSTMHVKHLLYTVMGLSQGKGGTSTDKEVLAEFNLPVTNQILKVRSLNTLISTFVEKLPKATTSDSKIHCQFKQVGADTGRMSSQSPNMQNIPSHATDIRHMFHASPSHVETRKCEVVDGIIHLFVPNIYMLQTPVGGKEAQEFYVGDYICLLKNHVPSRGIVLENSLEKSRNSYTSHLSIGVEGEYISSDEFTITVKSPPYVMLSSDYSAQEPRITAYVSNDPNMIEAFQKGRDIYASIASIAFKVPYEKCLEFHPETGEYQPDGKARRGEAKTIVLGICYGRSVPSIGEQLYSSRDDMSDEEKTKEAQKVYDAVMNSFPNLRSLMTSSQNKARKYGYTETILGRRRQLPDMQLSEFEFQALKNYVNPDVDPLDVATLENKSQIPERIVHQLQEEFKGYKYFGQIARRTRELYEQGIKVINNRPKINDATRQVVNSIVQGSAADLTKMAILELENNEEWKRLGGTLLIPVHDELICEAPIQHWEEAGKVLSKCMCDAADFFPFPSKCDVTTTFRWYGVEYPCPYKKPESISDDWSSTLSEDEIKWIQYHLYDLEYTLPVYKNEDGSKPRGDAALGIQGTVSEELVDAVNRYCKNRNITLKDFADDIEYRATNGIYRS